MIAKRAFTVQALFTPMELQSHTLRLLHQTTSRFDLLHAQREHLALQPS